VTTGSGFAGSAAQAPLQSACTSVNARRIRTMIKPHLDGRETRAANIAQNRSKRTPIRSGRRNLSESIGRRYGTLATRSGFFVSGPVVEAPESRHLSRA